MVYAAEVIADGCESADGLRGDGDLVRLSGFDYLVNFECALKEAVRDVGCGETQFDGLSFLEGDLIWRKFKSFGGDVDRLHGLVRTNGARGGHGKKKGDEGQGEMSGGEVLEYVFHVGLRIDLVGIDSVAERFEDLLDPVDFVKFAE